MRRTTLALAPVLSLVCLLWASRVEAEPPDTLVVKGEGETYKPGVATSWTGEGTEVTFVLADGTDSEQVATTLGERLASAQIETGDGKLVIKGIPVAVLLDQLSTVSLSGEAVDPLAALAGLGGAAVAMATPEGGGSIRASKPMGGPPGVSSRSIAEHNPGERFRAVVLSVARGEFPSVTLKLRVREGAKTGPFRQRLKSGTVVEASVLVAVEDGCIDFARPETQRNLGAYYLSRGDKVTLHPTTDSEGKLEIDWVERIK